MRSRSEARECALKILYQLEITHFSLEKVISDSFFLPKDSTPLKDFSLFLVKGVRDNLEKLDVLIKDYALNWDISRLAIVDKNILRIGIFELLFTEDIPPKVSINEAVELAKKYGDVDSPRFINGILDNIYRQKSSKYKPED